MLSEEFSAPLHAGHQENAIEVPFDPAKEWGTPLVKLWRGRNGHHANALINGFRFESVIVARMKKFFLLVNDEVCKSANIEVGEIVTVVLEPLAAPIEGKRSSI